MPKTLQGTRFNLVEDCEDCKITKNISIGLEDKNGTGYALTGDQQYHEGPTILDIGIQSHIGLPQEKQTSCALPMLCN